MYVFLTYINSITLYPFLFLVFCFWSLRLKTPGSHELISYVASTQYSDLCIYHILHIYHLVLDTPCL